MRAAVETAVAELGGLDIVVNCAAPRATVPKQPGLAALDDGDFLRQLDTKALGYLRVMFAVDDLDDTLARLARFGATVVDRVVTYGDTYRICYVRGPEGILIGLAQELG